MQNSAGIRKAVVPVGGLGTRLLPVTKVLPKEMLPVGRRPVIQYVVEEMRAAHLDQVCLVTGRKKALIQEHFDHDPELIRRLQYYGRDELLAELAYLESGLNLTFVRQSGPQGLADAIGLAASFVDNEAFVVALGDSIIRERVAGSLLQRLVRQHLRHQAVATIAVEPAIGATAEALSIVRPVEGTDPDDGSFAIRELLDAGPQDRRPGMWAVAARYVFGPRIFEAIEQTRPAWGGETQLTDAVRLLLSTGGTVRAVPMLSGERRHDIGSYDGYFRTFVDFALGDPYFGEEARAYLREACARELDWGLD